MSAQKILIIRFSSIGDIIQCMSIIHGIKNQWPESTIDWIVRKDMASLLRIDTRINSIIEFDRMNGLWGIIKMAYLLKNQGYTHIYDAHSNIRSLILKTILRTTHLGTIKPKLIVRRKNRFKRFLYFNFKINLLPNPFIAFKSFQKPLEKWDIICKSTAGQYEFDISVTTKVNSLISDEFINSENWITLVPSAAHDLKKWPTKYWIELIRMLPEYKFVIIGGPQDQFCQEIANSDPQRCINIAGKTSLIESFYLISISQFVISGDTGFLHAADLFEKNGIAIMGPSAFGYTTGKTIKILESKLPCRPCSKDGSGRCKIKETKKCLTKITPEKVKHSFYSIIKK